MTVIERILNDPRVESISDERAGPRASSYDPENGDGFWVYLKPGFINTMDGVHGYHEASPSECLRRLRMYTETCQQACECDYRNAQEGN